MRLREDGTQVMMMLAKCPTGPRASSVGPPMFPLVTLAQLAHPEAGGLTGYIHVLAVLAPAATFECMCGSMWSSIVHSLAALSLGSGAVRVRPNRATSHHPANTTFPSQPLRPSLLSPLIQLAVAPLASIDAATTRRIPYLDRGMDNLQFHRPRSTQAY